MTSRFLLFVAIIISIGSCSYQNDTTNSSKNALESKVSLSGFVADPEPVTEQPVPPLEIGAKAPDFKLPATDGRYYTLDDFSGSKALAIIFTCNHCPTAQAYEDRLISVVNDYKDEGVGFVAISPNSPLGLLYEELGYTDLNDDFEEMIMRVKDKGYNFTYLYDGDDQKVSMQYGPVATPHVFIFDAERKLAYRGRLDSVEKPGTANAEDFRSALDAILAGKTPTNPITKTFGCSTKWGWKLKQKEKANQEWKNKAVTLEKVDSEGIKNLLKNGDSGKLRLINVWATWCGPCILEYPDFIAISRMYAWRDFEFISISADNLKREAKALEILEKLDSAVPNYIATNDNKYDLIETIDPDWNGALPYTMLIEPGGNVVWKHQGEVDFYELKKVIVEHEMIGRYF